MLAFHVHRIFDSFFHFLFLLVFAVPYIRPDTLFASNRKPTFGALWNLNEMAECKLHYTALVYDDYGCWCGIGGSGTPIDGIDMCCKLHDQCYDLAVDRGLCYDTYVEYADPYSWTCQQGEPNCSQKQFGCKAALCECDKNVVNCWSKFKVPSKREKCTKTKVNRTYETVSYSSADPSFLLQLNIFTLFLFSPLVFFFYASF